MELEEFKEKVRSGEIFYDGKRFHSKEKPKTKIKKVKNAEKIDLFARLVKQELGIKCIPDPENGEPKEFQFCPDRKWRFDYYFPDYRIAVECEGMVWKQGRHTRGQGYINDAEKYSVAASMGFIVIRCTPQDLLSQRVLNLIKDSIKLRNNGKQ